MQKFLDKKRINQKKKTIKKVIIFIFLIILFGLGLLALTGRVFNFIGYPIWQMKNVVSSGSQNISYIFNTKSSLSSENKKLNEENSYLRLQMINYKILEAENNDLKGLLDRIPKWKDFTLANILSKSSISPYDTLIIDIGLNDNVKVGNVVYANGVLPIGTIEKVYDNTSLVYLYTNPGRKTEGFVDGLNASVELVGRGGGNFEMVIPMELQIEKDSIIYMPGSISLPLAIVREIISGDTDPFKKVILNSPVNVQSLKWVEVEK